MSHWRDLLLHKHLPLYIQISINHTCTLHTHDNEGVTYFIPNSFWHSEIITSLSKISIWKHPCEDFHLEASREMINLHTSGSSQTFFQEWMQHSWRLSLKDLWVPDTLVRNLKHQLHDCYCLLSLYSDSDSSERLPTQFQCHAETRKTDY